MSLDLHVDGDRWRAHLRSFARAHPGLVPVAKGNGYGFGLAGLARRTQWLGCDTVAVGTYPEVAEVERRFDGDVVVLEPWRPFTREARYGARIVHTVGRAEDLGALGRRDDRPRVLLEGLTSMRRHGFSPPDLVAAAGSARGVRVEGHALHLPLRGRHAAELEQWLQAAPARTWYVSHVGDDELAALRSAHPGVVFRPRIGTRLWLGDPGALCALATVLDTHPVRRGDRVGYRQRRIARDGTLLVVSGGTSHGVGLEAPSSASSARHRLQTLARGGMDAAGLALSPYLVAGKHRWFVEPPHMQVSLILLPRDVEPPAPGEQIPVRVRHTITTFDHVHLA